MTVTPPGGQFSTGGRGSNFRPVLTPILMESGQEEVRSTPYRAVTSEYLPTSGENVPAAGSGAVINRGPADG